VRGTPVEHVAAPADRRYGEMPVSQRTALGRSLVARALEERGFRVVSPDRRQRGLLLASAGAQEIEVQVRTANKRSGAPVWVQATFRPRPRLYAAAVLLLDGRAPAIYLIPSEAWLDPEPPLSDLQNPGGATPPEWRLNLTHDSQLARFAAEHQLPALGRPQ
jgi:hypothetical protein